MQRKLKQLFVALCFMGCLPMASCDHNESVTAPKAPTAPRFLHHVDLCPDLEDPDCDLRSMTGGEAGAAFAAIMDIQDDCEEMGYWLRQLYYSGRIKTFDHDFGTWGDIHGAGTMTAEVHIWEGAFSNPTELRNTLRHEAGHQWAGAGSTESQADQYMDQCWN